MSTRGAASPTESVGGAQRAGLIAGAAAFLLLLIVPLDFMQPAAQRTMAVAVLMAVWWITEAIPLAATALIPIVAFPALGVMPAGETTAPYGNPVIFLFLGGFLLAIAMEKWTLHRRIALAVVHVVGTSPRRLVLGFMCATAFLSMWISNTATVAMMLPIAIAIVELLRPKAEGTYPFAVALMLGVAYAATAGGIGTLIGTPPNAVFAASARELLGASISFTDWLMIGLPLTLVLLPLSWALLVYVISPPGNLGDGADAMLEAQRRELGGWSRGERITGIVFLLVAVALVLRETKPIGGVVIPGLEELAPALDDSTIVVFGALLLYLLPVSWPQRRFVLEWPDTMRLPWGVLLLFGGGLSLARAFETSGLTQAVAHGVGQLGHLPGWVLIAIVVTAFVFLSELASNTAIAAMGMPVLAAAAQGTGADPLPLMVAGALAASTAFMLPVGTPPNALIFGTGYVTMRDMIRGGIWLNLVSIVLVTFLCAVVVPAILR